MSNLRIASAFGSALIVLATTSYAPSLAQAQTPSSRSFVEIPNLDPASLDQKVDSLLRRNGQGIEAAIWLGRSSGSPLYERSSSRTMPTASAIKTFYLVEFFANRKGDLDHPVPGVDEILDNDNHPAISHFSAELKQDIRRTLKGKSARKLGEIMMGKSPASNAAYNAAANLITAVLGGPEALTGLIHARDAAFSKVLVRRYMLRDRKLPGDNEAPAAALAALYQKLATHSLLGIDRETIEAIREAMIKSGDEKIGIEYSKSGNLESDPLTRVEAGWRETPHGVVVYVVMLRQPTPGPGQTRSEASKTLATSCDSIRRQILDATANRESGSSR